MPNRLPPRPSRARAGLVLLGVLLVAGSALSAAERPPRALAVDAEPALTDGANTLTVRASITETAATAAWALRTLRIVGVTDGGEVALRGECPAPPGEAGWTLPLELAGEYTWDRLTIRAALLAEDRILAAGETRVYSRANLAAHASRLARALHALPREKQHTPEGALLRLGLEQVTLLEARTQAPTLRFASDYYSLLQRSETALRALAFRTAPYQGPPGHHEAAYITRNDGSVQPFRVYAPRAVGAAREENRRLPLLLFLHGYVPGYTKLDWLSIPDVMAESMEELGMLLALPYGRSNTDFLGVGEVDVLRVLEEMRTRYPVDGRRIYLAGYSMGGSGVWTMLSHYPDRFAAAQVWCGRTDWYTWHAEPMARLGLSRETLPRYKRILIDTDTPLLHADTLRDLPVHAVHARDDLAVKVGHTVRMHERLAPPDGRMRTTLLATGGHFVFSREWADAESYRWMLEHTRQPPETLRHVAMHPRYGRKYWLGIGRIAPWGSFARVEAELDRGTRSVRLRELTGVDRLRLHLPQNGEPPWRLLQPDPRPLTLRTEDGRAGPLLEGPERPPPLKTAGLGGPVKEAFRTAFLLVPGTIGEERTRRDLARNTERFRREWYEYAQGLPSVVEDREVTDALMQRFNLVCFGTPATNAVLRRLADRMPFTFPENGYGVGSLEARGEGLGFAAIYPNPDAPGRSVVILDGLYYGAGLPRNHKWDLVPDYLVFDARRAPLDGSNRARIAGFFDVGWQFDPELAETFDPPGQAPSPAAAPEAESRVPAGAAP